MDIICIRMLCKQLKGSLHHYASPCCRMKWLTVILDLCTGFAQSAIYCTPIPMGDLPYFYHLIFAGWWFQKGWYIPFQRIFISYSSGFASFDRRGLITTNVYRGILKPYTATVRCVDCMCIHCVLLYLFRSHRASQS